MQNEPLEHLIRQLAALPGLGGRSARRIALHLLGKRQAAMLPLSNALRDAAENVKTCSQCGNLDMHDPCGICRDEKRAGGQLCIVAHVSDLWALERTGAYKGRYFVLGGVLSALDGIGPEDLGLYDLVDKVRLGDYTEIILALAATVDGQSTAHMIGDLLKETGVPITRLAHGVPIGGELDYLDDGTITTALNARSTA